MRELTGSTRIRVRAPRKAPARKPLTGDTRIKLSQIKDFLTWRKNTADTQGVESPDGAKSPKGDKKKVGGDWVYVPVSERGGGAAQAPREFSADYQENKRKLTSVFEAAKKKLSSEEIKAVKNYTKTSKEINAFSRGEKVDPSKVPQLKAQQSALDNALKKTEVGENVIAYRTVSIPQDKIDSVIPTQNIPISKIPAGSRNLYLQKTLETTPIRSTEKGYISTTINPNYQMNRQNAGEAFVSYKINVPKEAHGLYLGKLSAKKHQDELLVLRNYSLDFKKVKYDARSDRYEIEADLLLD
ncbi:MAG: hypothetical protein J6W46_10185 [Spirochaetaceae bacterium]|nr:hypothetical protein [Spirochaetaceae bacterium]